MKSFSLLKILTLGILVTSIFTSVFCSEEFKIYEEDGNDTLYLHDLSSDMIDKISTINLKNLNSLNLMNCEIDDTVDFKNFKNIKSLSFNECDVDSLTGLDKLKNLENLKFYRCAINNTKMEVISKITNLNEM